MIQLPQLHESLLIANERLVDRARRRARLFRTGLISSAAVLSIGGAATAGLALWNPILGHEDGNRPSISQSPVPATQSAALGVLRREQTAADRGLVAQEALTAASKRYVGVRLGAVRVLLGTDGPGNGLAIIPVARLRPRSTAGPGAEGDSLCVYQRTSPAEFSSRCFGTSEVRSGEAAGGVGSLTWGLVPDGVDRISLRSTGGASVLPVRDNAFTVSTASVDRQDPVVEWQDATGRPILPVGGMAMSLPVDLGVRPAVPDGFHDCGAARGNVVPDAIACGREAERYRTSPDGLPDTGAP